MDIYYMHCNQMEAAHPSSRAVTLVTNVSHKDTPPTTTTTSAHPPLCLSLLLCENMRSTRMGGK